MSKNLVIIPTYNEKENIKKIILKVFSLEKKFEILIVDDGSPDGTAKIVKDMQKKFQKNLHIQERTGKLGLGTAYIHGFKWGLKNNYDYIFEMDADFSHDPNELIRNIDFFIKEKLDLLIASRYLPGSKIINWSLSRRILSKLSNFLARNLLNIPLKDFTNGFRIYSPRAIERIISSCGNIGDGFILLSEIIVVIKNNLMQIGEIQTNFVNRERGVSSVNFKLVMASLYGIIKLAIIKKKLK
ncbi:MAG: polyprenol monophosphomannose synthase [Flavobacteriales bacterium]|nr:polyprenol monophosphomannose synthase [Flavobacteriales bacterium]